MQFADVACALKMQTAIKFVVQKCLRAFLNHFFHERDRCRKRQPPQKDRFDDLPIKRAPTLWNLPEQRRKFFALHQMFRLFQQNAIKPHCILRAFLLYSVSNATLFRKNVAQFAQSKEER